MCYKNLASLMKSRVTKNKNPPLEASPSIESDPPLFCCQYHFLIYSISTQKFIMTKGVISSADEFPFLSRVWHITQLHDTHTAYVRCCPIYPSFLAVAMEDMDER